MGHSNWMEAAIANPGLVDDLYKKFTENPNSVDSSWFFAFSDSQPPISQLPTITPQQQQLPASADLRVYNLIEAYRTYGHEAAHINPIAIKPIKEPPTLQLESFGLSSKDLSQLFPTYGLLPEAKAPLSRIIDRLKRIYCSNIGVEYMYLENPELERWIQEQMESGSVEQKLTPKQRQMILEQLNRSELFESFIHTRYTGQKRFSLEGGETLIPMLQEIVDLGGDMQVSELILGMAHRGRLNVLSNILKKSHVEIFSEFEEGYISPSFEGSDDVKYHKGYSSEVVTYDGHKMKIALTPNPSHLESVDAVVEGMVRAKQLLKGGAQDKVLPVLIHGDAAISGQGIVYETMQLCQLPGYATGGTLHIVVNNQVGFTASPKEMRSTQYCTDIAHAFSAPVFHVNAEDPDACVYVTLLAVKIRQQFHCDVFIDLNCYRKYGHNESDEPAYTQPLEYQMIRKKRAIREIYRDQLIQTGIVEKQLVEKMESEFTSALHSALEEGKNVVKQTATATRNEVTTPDQFPDVHTAVSKELLETVAERISSVPEGFNIHPKLQNLVQERLSMIKGEKKPIDWGMAELMAYGTLLWEGTPVRISGQDCCRGTFSHRHAAWMDQAVERAYYPLAHLSKDQGRFDVLNSPLSEYAVLGFEFGYSSAWPEALVIWEAQFGDFCNGAQIVIDQYIATSEQKWAQKVELTLFLPHGYEGQGPEHSSGRMERFLTLAGHDNMRIANPTTPAQFFHLLRRQAKTTVKKPLIVFTPKGLLRFPACVSSVKDLTEGKFDEILADPQPGDKIEKLVFCTGRIYYDLIAERSKRKTNNMAIVRIEQLYPLHQEKIAEMMKHYAGFKKCIWVQEEPQNMGAWGFINPLLKELLPKGVALHYIGRGRSASPAVGSYSVHKKQHAEIIQKLFSEDSK